MDNIKEITYLGKTIKTKNFIEVTDEEREAIKKDFFTKPDKEAVIKQMKKLNIDGVMNDKVTRYYFRDLMAHTQIETGKWSIEDVFNSNELLGIFKAKVLNNRKIFPEDKTMANNIERAIALGGKGYAKFPTQFPMQAAVEVYRKYNINNIVYDFSCGWGIRLMGALRFGLKYYGTDPNYVLCERLQDLYETWRDNINSKVQEPKIYTQGSEINIPELENKVGLAFSSPPYFSLEDYKIGNQSYKPGMNYNDWVNNYLYPTLKNIYSYLIDGGILAINIKDTTVPLVKSVELIAEELGFKFIEVLPLKNIKRLKSTGGLTDTTDEGIYIYRKLNIY